MQHSWATSKKKKKPSHTKTDKQIENLHLNLKLQ